MTEQYEPSRNHLENPVHISEDVEAFARQHGVSDEQRQRYVEHGLEQELREEAEKLGEALHASRQDTGDDPKRTQRLAEDLETANSSVFDMIGRILGFRGQDNNNPPGPNQ